MEGVEEQLGAVLGVLREDGGDLGPVECGYDHVIGVFVHDAVDVLEVLGLSLHVCLEESEESQDLALALCRLLLEVDYKLIIVALNLLKLQEALLAGLPRYNQSTHLLLYLLVARVHKVVDHLQALLRVEVRLALKEALDDLESSLDGGGVVRVRRNSHL